MGVIEKHIGWIGSDVERISPLSLGRALLRYLRQEMPGSDNIANLRYHELDILMHLMQHIGVLFEAH